MATTTLALTAFLITFNLVFFTLVSSTPYVVPPIPSTIPSEPPCPPPAPAAAPPTIPPTIPSEPPCPPAAPPAPAPPPAECDGGQVTTPTPSPTPSTDTCPADTLKLGVCGDLLSLVNIVIGSPSNTPCCSLISGLTDLDAAVCLCTAIKTNILGINLNVPVSLSLLLNYCDKKAPSGFQCA